MSVTVYEILSILFCLQFTHHISIPDHFYSDFPVSFILEVWIWCHACCTAARNTWMFSLSQVWPGTSGWAVSKLGYRRCGQRMACKASWIEVGIHFEMIFCVFVNLEMTLEFFSFSPSIRFLLWNSIPLVIEFCCRYLEFQGLKFTRVLTSEGLISVPLTKSHLVNGLVLVWNFEATSTIP